MYKVLYDPNQGVVATPLIHRQLGLDPLAALLFPAEARVDYCTDGMEVYALDSKAEVLLLIIHAAHTREGVYKNDGQSSLLYR